MEMYLWEKNNFEQLKQTPPEFNLIKKPEIFLII